jgi:hypothetical protein
MLQGMRVTTLASVFQNASSLPVVHSFIIDQAGDFVFPDTESKILWRLDNRNGSVTAWEYQVTFGEYPRYVTVTHSLIIDSYEYSSMFIAKDPQNGQVYVASPTIVVRVSDGAIIVGAINVVGNQNGLISSGQTKAAPCSLTYDHINDGLYCK